MTDYTAIVEAGEALQALLREGICPEPVNNPEMVALCSPHENEENNQLTVFLFNIESDSANTQSGYYQATRDTQRIHPNYYALYYLITAHSKAPAHLREADRSRIIGAVMQTLVDYPVIPARLLKGSLAGEGVTLHVSMQRTTLDEMMKIWNNNSTTYKVSIVVKVESVPIMPRRERRIARVGEIMLDTEVKPQIPG